MGRKAITLTILILGIALATVSYLLLCAPFGADGIEHSDPRMQFAPALVVLGVILAFGSAVVYELLPDRYDEETEGSSSP